MSLPPTAAPTSSFDAVRWLRRSLLLTTAIKLLLAAVFPLTGDEAYFIQWGRSLEGSYYDHGPMTGWWIWLCLQLGEDPLVVRLPAVGASLLTGWLLWRILRARDPHSAALAATLFLWSPAALLSVFITTDVPLVVFSALAVAAAIRAHVADHAGGYVATGALLGLAFLSKYFAVLLGLAFAVWWLLACRPRRPRAVGWVLVGVLPFAVQHMYWNFHHSWTNVMFNVFTRQSGDRGSWLNPLVLVVLAAWLIGPILWWVLRRRRLAPPSPVLRNRPWRQSRYGLAACAFLVPHAVFLLVSLRHPVGLHWLLSFQPFFFLVLPRLISAEALTAAVRATTWFGGVQAAVALLAIAVPVEWLRSQRSYPSIVLGLHPAEVLAAIAPHRDGRHLATPSYAKSALLEFHADAPVRVLGRGSYHGRQDDLRTDFRALAGADFVLLANNPQQLDAAARWFTSSEVHPVVVRDAEFQLFVGHGFRYETYREDVLRPVAEAYYRMPKWLEDFSSGCFFRERYGFPAAHATAPLPDGP